MYDEAITLSGQAMMMYLAELGGGQPGYGGPHGVGVALTVLLVLAIHALFIKAVFWGIAAVRRSIRRQGLVMTLAMCLFAGYAAYVGGSKRIGGGTDTDDLTRHSGRGGTDTGETTVRGGEGPEGGNAGPSRVVFQAAVEGAVFPVCLTGEPGTLVQAVMLAAIGDAADLATLVDAPETARIRVAEHGGAEPVMTAMEQSLTAQFVPAQWLVAEIDFEAPVPLGSLRFGDSAGRPLWLRGWQGGIAEVVCFDVPPGGDVRAGVANYLAVKGKFYGYRATYAQRQAAIAAGLNYGLVWGTVIIVR